MNLLASSQVGIVCLSGYQLMMSMFGDAGAGVVWRRAGQTVMTLFSNLYAEFTNLH